MKNVLLTVGLSSILLAGCSLSGNLQTPVESSPLPATSPSSATTDISQSITLSEIASHKKATDCWFAVDGKVYDVTPYIADQQHPGGADILKGCGKDATELFHTKGNEGEDHSQDAQNYMQNFQIGVLAQ